MPDCSRKESEADQLSKLNSFTRSSRTKVYITTNGCSENRLDCARMESFFARNGWAVTEDLRQADLILFNACGLTTVKENHSLEVLGYINGQKKYTAEVIVWGCFPKINLPRLTEFHQGIIFNSDQEERLEDFFAGDIKAQDIQANYLVKACEIPSPAENNHRFRNISKAMYYLIHPRIFLGNRLYARASQQVSFVDPEAFPIKISTGCLDACAYCGTRFSRGRLRSKPAQKVLEEFREGLEKNHKSFILIGTDLGAYGRDLGTSLVDLLNAISQISGDYKIKLPNINPRWLTDLLPGLLELVRSGKIEVISSPVQCGSNKILRLMNRRYRVEDFLEAMASLQESCPEVRICTALIAGFPGETEKDFEETLRLLNEVDFAFVYVHRYSPRPGTKAAEMPKQVPLNIIEDRYNRLMENFIVKYRRKAIF